MDSSAVNKPSLDLIKKYLPNTYKAYLDMVERILK